ncbi:hypothetical protein MHUMG1_02361 [Metarhizium humberi]|uniref:Chromatin modification-related protein EAF3 n=1 Tax=Metarhizium humberi TaxID=2596975 RepID=A0A9P8MFR7_9HYPO|nr:hypothetical protein MHUMG1_02361 [Metarhizium humberi]
MAPARQQQTPQFNKDEKVLCFHMDMLYEAKVMDVQPGEKPGDGFRYKVHYKGWKNTWDDWVLADRIRPFDDEHKELAAQLHAQVKSSMQKNSKQPKKNLKGGDSARGSEERGSGAPQGGRGGRRGKDWELEQPWCAASAGHVYHGQGEANILSRILPRFAVFLWAFMYESVFSCLEDTMSAPQTHAWAFSSCNSLAGPCGATKPVLAST